MNLEKNKTMIFCFGVFLVNKVLSHAKGKQCRSSMQLHPLFMLVVSCDLVITEKDFQMKTFFAQ